MPYKYHPLRSLLIVALLMGIVAIVTSSAELTPVEQTLQAIDDCIARSPAPWPDEWKKEYIDTIHRVIKSYQDIPQYAERLEVLRKGFGLYWEEFKKTPERSLFEVHRTRIRWYTEHLMGTKFPNEDEIKKLCNQYKDLWNHAAGSLLKQFPFLDPNTVQEAKADHLSQCYRKIEAPLLPIYLRPFSEAQVGQIKKRWVDLRYARVELLRQIGFDSKTSNEDRNVQSFNTYHHYQLTQRSLSQLLGLVWMVVPQRPDYYRNALENRTKALEHRVKSMREARSDQQRLEKERSRQLLQTEHISFLLAALLETTQCLDGSASIREKEEIQSEQQDKSAKGGGAL